MRIIVVVILQLMVSINAFSQNVGIGTENPNPSAALDITDNSRGLLIPRMTKAQRLNINNPAEGLYVYQTDDNKGFWYYDGTTWVSFIKLPPGAAQNKVITFCDGELTWTIGGQCPGKITALNCSNSTLSDSLIYNNPLSGVILTVPYTGGNSGVYALQTVASTGVTGLTATLAAGSFANGAGNLSFSISGTATSSGTASFLFSIGGVQCTFSAVVYEPGLIASINCGSVTNTGSLAVSGAASGVSTIIGYTGGDGGAYESQTISSSGVTGLTATLNPGLFANGSGSLTFDITGSPSDGGKASFLINIGGQTCSFSRTVASEITIHACGANNVHNPAIGYGVMLDQENNNYRTVRIGAQTWMAENLKTSIYRNGDPIPQVTENSAWISLENGAYSYFNNDASNDCPYGKLYNWYAISDNRHICPTGWHVPTETDWVVLENYLGNFVQAGGKMRSTGTQYWLTSNAGATNESGFSALPGGYRSTGVTDFYKLGTNAIWWSSTASGSESARYRGTLNTGDGELFFGASPKFSGYSVRCIKDAEASDAGTIASIDCNSASNSGDVFASTEITAGVTSTLSYSGGNEGIYQGQSINSTGVTGLTATLLAGTFANGSGILSFEITGTPGSSGTASFAISIGGQTCILTRSVGVPDPLASHSCGSTYVHNVTLPYGMMTDQEGNQYRTIRIGAQNWMAENLKTTIYRNGDPVPMVETKAAWQELTTGAYAFYNNNASNNCPYGKLYNWYAATDNRNICPVDWHIPTEEEWVILENYLGGFGVAGGKMRSTGTSYWSLSNSSATNESGFSGLPGGYRPIAPLSLNDFLQLRGQGFWWSASPNGTESARYIGMSGGGETTLFSGASLRGSGFSLRCVQDPNVGSITGLNCASPVNTGELTNGTNIISGVSSTISYTGGNLGVYNGQTISSTGVTGLTATLVAGTFANGAGSLTLDITGTPATTGTASFALIIGGQTCTLTRTVTASDPLAYHTCGSTYVHNVSLTYGSLTDQEGNQYKTIQIGTQEWMAENLKTSIYRNGNPIQNVENKTTWSESTTGAYCFYNNEASKNCPYGKLYNWYAVNDNRNICPTGWHVPTSTEWQTLEDYLGGFTQAGNKMRTSGIQYWLFFNQGATNESGFSALPGGYRAATPTLDFYNLGNNAIWWSSTIQGTDFANYFGTENQNFRWSFFGSASQNKGYSVRCIKD